MIRRVIIDGFKRFDRIEFTLPGHIIIAGPNNTGKTTVLQAVAAWSLALQRWKELNDFQRHGGAYTKAPIARQAFSAVPLRSFDLLWRNRDYAPDVKVTLVTDAWSLAMEFKPDSTEQIYVRPEPVAPELLKTIATTAVLIPPMSGLSTEEPVYTRPKLEQLLGQARPGEMLRNVLLQASESQPAWESLQAAIGRLFGYELVPPDGTGAHIVAEYRHEPGGPRFDVASGGSGFQQVLMLLALLNTRPGSVLLLDEPDAHLHVFLQDAIFGELRQAAIRTRAQFIVATHSEVIINAVDARELCVLLDKPVMLADDGEREALIRSLRVLSNDDIMRAMQAPGVLYLEGHTDLAILQAFARALDHPALPLLTTKLFWKPTVADTAGGGAGIKARDHYEALRLVRNIPALELIDGDSHPGIQGTAITGQGLQRARWRRYEIESYLVHPAALARFVETMVGPAAAGPHVAGLMTYLNNELPPAVVANPFGDHQYLVSTKARRDILPPALNAAGLPNLPYSRYSEIAAGMLPEEIHPEVIEKLDAIVAAFQS